MTLTKVREMQLLFSVIIITARCESRHGSYAIVMTWIIHVSTSQNVRRYSVFASEKKKRLSKPGDWGTCGPPEHLFWPASEFSLPS